MGLLVGDVFSWKTRRFTLVRDVVSTDLDATNISVRFDSEGFDLDAVMLCDKWEKKFEGIAVGLNGIVAHSHDVEEVLVEEAMDARGKLHFLFHSCQRVKSNRFFLLCALAILR